MSLKQMMLERLEQVQGSPKKSLGQNFLINQHVVDAIIGTALLFNTSKSNAVPFEEIIEIGPGLGALTEQLKNFEQPLTLIEMDNQFVKFWKEHGQNVIDSDALKLDWDALVEKPTCLVSNLPYQISARLVIELSFKAKKINSMVLMFQKEVAQRIVAEPSSKDYGFLSIIAQKAWQINKVCDASPQDFYPPPKVSSRVLGFQRKALLPESFVQFTKKAFENRRKFMLKNFPDKKEVLTAALSEMGFDEKVRAEQLSVENFEKLYEVWSQS